MQVAIVGKNIFDKQTKGWANGIIVRAVAVALLGLFSTTVTLAADTQSGVRRVVILNGSDAHLPAFLALDKALQTTVREGSGEPVRFFDETLDIYRFEASQLEDRLSALLKAKYEDLRVDVVVAYGTAGLAFAQRYRRDIWPGAAIVFLSVSKESLVDMEVGHRTAGVLVDQAFGETIDLALQLRPKTKRIAVVAGSAEVDRRVLSEAQAALQPYLNTLDVQYLVGLTLEDTVAGVQALSPDAIVLYVTVFRDGSGEPRIPLEVLRQIAAVSPVPVFGAFETYLDSGITAGAISGYGAQGRRAGEIVNRILAGEDPSAIGTDVQIAPTCMADWRQLSRWGINAKLLPQGCEVRFREESVWDQYRWQILASLAVILTQSVLIILLVLNRRRLSRAQTALQSEHALRTEIEKNAAQLQWRLTRFSRERSLGAMATTLAHEISQPLIAIQNYVQAASRRLRGDIDDRPKVIELLGKIEGQAERAGTITQRVRSLVSHRETRMSPTSISTLIEDVMPMVQSECDALGCRIEYHPASDLVPVLADVLQIQLVLVNLLSNALHSITACGTAAGVIAIDVEILNSDLVQVSVADEGIGIAPDRIQYIFEPLYSDKRAGMGVGLAICREIIDLHGGRIWYEPNPRGGAIIRFTLRVDK